ncbi:hypothetical protein B0T14DRAFT_591458 [Immersiella caudata]|uniref:ubiquitinyl hydrolase 1 n=1 Tax=Immersiella caudata TaxID=314043 RepID=A0AA39WDW8_9PEZI|nr:hypothetical protein B0T14DRAFT_591458 [Immersiella caudata]
MATDLLAASGMPLDMPTLDFMIHHVFLPPRLPQKDDKNGQHLLTMAQVLRDSVSAFMVAERSSAPSLQPALDMLNRFLRTSPESGAGKTKIVRRDELRSVIHIALLHLRDQNAGLLLTSRQDDILFESFELLAPNKDVMSCKGSLLREFPDRAVAVPIGKLQDPALLDVLVDSIQELESTVAPKARPKVKKAKTVQPEERDTLSPVLATGLLTDILAGLGQKTQPERIIKRSREQVCWDDALLPFHRSATWLLLRVALRLVLDRGNALQGGASWYKPLMAHHCARILDMALRAPQASISSDKVFSMQAKLVRRIKKLDPAGDSGPAWINGVQETTRQATAALQTRWTTELAHDNRSLPLDQLSKLSFHRDSELKLTGLLPHLSWVETRNTSQQGGMGEGDLTTFSPNIRLELLPRLGDRVGSDSAMDFCELAEFEAWVESSLSDWVSDNRLVAGEATQANVRDLTELIQAYHMRASTVYKGIPAALSVMYLVIAELWVAMDTIAGKETPLLLDYDPGFPPDIFHPLLLERKEEMQRLHAVENYFVRRRGRAPRPYSSAFTGFGSPSSFAVLFSRASAEHRRLRREIEDWGTKMKAEKLEEYKSMRQKYNLLTKAYETTECDQYWDSHWEEQTHSPSCRRCGLKEKMETLKIDVFEWPLPTDPSYADAAVFEISVPPIVALWRDATWKLVTQVFWEKTGGGLPEAARETLYFAAERQGMGLFSTTRSHLQPASTVKPMEVAHYKKKHIRDATATNVCVPHAAQYSYYERTSRVSTENVSFCGCIPRDCSYAELIKGDPVEDWVRYATHTSNDVIAEQHRCPLTLPLREFRSLGNLRSGVGLQWANILCQLEMPSLDFNKQQTLALILQACLEAGPQSDSGSGNHVDSIWRVAHTDTQKETFMSRILSSLREALLRVRESWQNNIALCVLTCLATRLLALSPSADVSSGILEYLGQLREVSIGWARLLRDKLDKSNSSSDRETWINRLLMATLTCAATFGVEEVHLEHVLSDPHNLSWLVESAVLARNYLPPSGRPANAICLQLMQRWHTAMHRARHLVARQILHQKNPGLDMAIKRLWADFSPSPDAGWAPFDLGLGDGLHILTCKNEGSILVTFNLLTGAFFLNGYPLSRLPSSYQGHQTIRQLFGEQILDVGPSSAPGMKFSASRDLNGWVLHFAMVDSRLVVRAVRDSSQGCKDGSSPDGTYEYIPREHLNNDLPNSFVNGYAHWLHLETGRVEFRPIDRKWDWDIGGWCLTQEDHKYILSKGSRVVLDPSSPTAQFGHLVMGAIESPGDTNLILDRDDNTLAFELPRLSLSFQAQQGKCTIQSKNYSSMQIDGAQGIGSLVGLVNKLVLKPESGSGFRMVLVPRGQVSYHLTSVPGHVKVSIQRGDDKRIHHDAFYVNDKLGCLNDTGSLQSKLYLCHLHALTSHCLPDPLTSRTGTEEALRILQGAAVRSYPTLDSGSRTLLGEIASLTPRREYYPKHLQDMEQTAWKDTLPSLSQHDEFLPLAKRIFGDYQKLGKLFQPNWRDTRDVLSEQATSNAAQRARIRNAVFRVSEFGAEEHTTAVDKWYHPRERKTTIGPGGDTRVSELVRHMDTGTQTLAWSPCSNLATKVEDVNGSKFTGNPLVPIGFRLNNLGVPAEVLRGLWCGLHRTLAVETNKYKRIFYLSTLLYAESSDPQVVQTLMALGSISVFAQANMLPPPDDKFDLTITRATLDHDLTRVANGGKKDRKKCPEQRLTKMLNESVRELERRRDREWASKSQAAVKQFVGELTDQVSRSWTVHTPSGSNYRSYLAVDQIMPHVTGLVETARRSEAFRDYLSLLSKTMHGLDVTKSSEPVLVSARPSNRPPSRPGVVSAASLFSVPAPYADGPISGALPTVRTEVRQPDLDHSRLSALVDELSRDENRQEHEASYISELRGSIAARPDAVVNEASHSESLEEAQKRFDSVRQRLELALAGTSIADRMCIDAGYYPRVSPVFLLQRLTRRFWSKLSDTWRRCLVDFALNLVLLQRAERLHALFSARAERGADLQRELSNPGDHENPDWDPLQYPENLLLEVEQGIMIRPVQNKIAAAMRSPPGMKNAVMQLNMGEGKSSVIVPIVAAALADGEQLVRIVVAKPQSNQMTHMLIGKLGGLLNRQVFYLPLSRSLQLSRDGVTIVREMVERCKAEGGVLLVQPEHLLSFKLMGVDKTWDPEGEKGTQDAALGRDIVRLYQDFESVSRDIVDESDENFSVKYELIYTMGAQEAVEMSPGRWILIQQLLDLIETAVRRLMGDDGGQKELADGLIFEDNVAGRVPIIRILEESTGRHLLEELAATVCRRGLTGFPVFHQSERMRQAVRNYISIEHVDPVDISLVEDPEVGLFSSQTTKNALLLLRGLLAKGVLSFALGQKRFRVNYGLAPTRRPQTTLAVPYRAKDMPSPRSEFSHPDVVIVLTCLSYYYGGLSDEQLYACFELLHDSDQAEQEYGRWASKAPGLPPSFRHFSSINVEDKPQCESIVFPALRHARPVIDFFLAHVVFPREMKQFPLKLSSSGWDLARPKAHPMTGFSGTNDSKGVLPLEVAALDLQPHTNASVLSTILGDENNVLEVGADQASRLSALSEEMLLSSLAQSQPPMRVILDVGAQIVESSNLQMATKLLDSAPLSNTDAVIFFDDQDELSVLLRNGDVVPFLTSPFATRADRCLVFLDQAHTRGTDLKLPDDYRAAVTLGPGITKDTLVQACMRMRKLGRGQSVTFVVSPEMQKRIRAVRSAASERPLNVADVIAWAISETWDEAVRSVPLWAAQGIRHIRQEAIWKQAKERGVFSPSDAQEYLEPEAVCLEERYQPNPMLTNGNTEVAKLMAALDLQDRADSDKMAREDPQISAIREKLRAFSRATRTNAASSTLQEEQERELAPEIEEERQVARPPPRNALRHKLDDRLVQFVHTGNAELLASAASFRRCYSAMSTTSAASLFNPGLAAFPSGLLVTHDFARTVEETGPSYRSDSYQRGAHWVLVRSTRIQDEKTVPEPAKIVVVSQWEANQLKHVIEKLQQDRQSKDAAASAPVTLHAYLPRSSLTFSSMEHLKTYTVPALPADWEAPRDLVMQLNLFAGQLYLRSYDEYKRLCGYLGLAYTENEDQETAVPPDGFVGQRKYPNCKFELSPVAFLAKVYHEIRGDCVGGMEKTHMGKILAGEILTERDFPEGKRGGH